MIDPEPHVAATNTDTRETAEAGHGHGPGAASTHVFESRRVGQGPSPEALSLELAPGLAFESAPAWPGTVCAGGAMSGDGLAKDFGKYELLAEIGRGGMGVVFKARHKELGRVVALKMILSSHLASDEHIERFHAEARAAAQLDSPHIVGIHDVGQINGQHFFEMDFVDGPSLAQVLHDGPLDPMTAARHLFSVARTVSILHRNGIIHRDLKPSNVLMAPDGRLRVTDFGLAKILQSDGNVTRSGAIVGTPCYMSPEQAAGKVGEVGPASDLYSLGAILYEMLTGRPPFPGRTPLDTLVQVLETEPPRPRRLRPGIPRALELLCLKCLERDPRDRYVSAQALATDLDHFLRGEPIEARRLSFVQGVRRWTRREPALVSRLGTLAVCGAIYEVNHLLIRAQPAGEHRPTVFLALLWGLLSVLFQAMLTRRRLWVAVQYAWAVLDVVMFTALVSVNRGLTSSLVAGYFLLIVASGLWFQEHVVWIATGLAVLGYGALVRQSGVPPVISLEAPYSHVIFVAALAVTGLITGHQVRRVRALSQYYEHRPLP
jgi:serine/threonine-protein kinase